MPWLSGLCCLAGGERGNRDIRRVVAVTLRRLVAVVEVREMDTFGTYFREKIDRPR